MTEVQSMEIRTCPTVSSHETTVSVPICIVPFANPGTVVVQCCGEPIIEQSGPCHGTINGNCEFVISQRMRVDIPMVFGASVMVGETCVECGCITGTTEEEFDFVDTEEEE